MPTLPKIVTLTNSSVEVLNVIRENATQNYKDYVPVASPNPESIKEIGAIIMDFPALQNEFLSALVNRIGRVIVTSKMYENPWKMFKKGLLEMGETVEEIFVNISKPFQYNANGNGATVFKKEVPDVRSAFHILNYKKYYKATVMNDQLRTAFLSWTGITDLIAKIIDAMYTAANYDEFLTMKYMIARQILKGQMKPVTIPTVTADNMKSIVSTIKGVSNTLEFLSSEYNLAGVKTHTLKEDQYIIVNSKFDATMDVEVLASAFNMDKAQFMGKRVLVDSFGALDLDRLAILFAEDSTYKTITTAEATALDSIPAIIVDKEWFMIFDNFQNMTEQYNGEDLYWNYWYHTWKTFSISPFANTALFIAGTPSVTSVTVSPTILSLEAGQSAQFSAVVVTEKFAPQSVIWSVNSEISYVTKGGMLYVSEDETAETLTVTATSVFDATETGSATVTVL